MHRTPVPFNILGPLPTTDYFKISLSSIVPFIIFVQENKMMIKHYFVFRISPPIADNLLEIIAHPASNSVSDTEKTGDKSR